MPFTKGQSGNPGGRPKRIPKWVAEFRRLEPAMLRELKAAIKSKKTPPAVRLKAIELALAYSRGKPRQALELSGKDGEPIEMSVSSADLLAQLQKLEESAK